MALMNREEVLDYLGYDYYHELMELSPEQRRHQISLTARDAVQFLEDKIEPCLKGIGYFLNKGFHGIEKALNYFKNNKL